MNPAQHGALAKRARQSRRRAPRQAEPHEWLLGTAIGILAFVAAIFIFAYLSGNG